MYCVYPASLTKLDMQNIKQIQLKSTNQQTNKQSYQTNNILIYLGNI